ncbi:hypothetical protein CCR75_006792 [Bremia lactucae]|uniref:Uncharacterized protein n=1 Tax=Bremia lactucae TaxID=4779 RepID=A0A976IDI1_BRELC|nr:hypothetical protein CCR75_006792 [Bremia lactucae]
MTVGNTKRRRTQPHNPGEALVAEDLLLHMNTSLMTERQQLAFLLRTTAREADVERLEEDAKKTSCLTINRSQMPSAKLQETVSKPRHGSVGRPLKTRKVLRVVDMELNLTTQKDPTETSDAAKSSPSASDDVMRLDAMQFGHYTHRCALCCEKDTVCKASFLDALFLCPACDQKYPTQQTLKWRACVT